MSFSHLVENIDLCCFCFMNLILGNRHHPGLWAFWASSVYCNWSNCSEGLQYYCGPMRTDLRQTGSGLLTQALITIRGDTYNKLVWSVCPGFLHEWVKWHATNIEYFQRTSLPCPPLENLGWLDCSALPSLRRWPYQSPPPPLWTSPQLSCLK